MSPSSDKSAFWRLLMVGALSSAATLGYAADCNELIRLGLYNVNKSVSEHDSLVSAYHHLCDERYDTASTERKTSMGISFGYLKVKLGLSGGLESSLSQSTQTKFCTDTNNVNKLYTYNSADSQQIYEGSLNAWQNCLAMQARGLKSDIRPTSTFSAVSFDLYWTGSYPAQFRGIAQPDLGKANCTVTTTMPVNGVSSTVTQAVAANTLFPLTTKASSFVCSRVMTTLADGTKYSEVMRLTVKTSDGSFDIDLPPLVLRRVPITEINGIYDKMTVFDTSIESLTNTVNNLKLLTPHSVNRTLDTVYQNTTGQTMYVSVVTNSTTTGTTFFYSDNNSNPSLIVSAQSGSNTWGRNSFFIVPPNYYYKGRTDTGGSVVWWVEWY